jgi:AcrR family transcriptional regulator
MEDLIYVYCVMDEMPVLEHPAVSECPDLLVHDGLYAVVGRVPPSEFSEEALPARLNDLAWLTEKVKLHERIVEHAMQYGCVIPFKFGTVFKSENRVHAMLEAHAAELRRNLAELTGKSEWGVKVYCDRQRLTAAVAAKNPVLVDLEREIGAAPSGRAFLLTKRRGELIAAAVNGEIARLGQECFDRLSKQGLKARPNDLLRPEATGRPEEMILNSAFLVPQDKTPQFLSTIDWLREQFGSQGLLFECTGPWPPYNFCEFSRERAQLG